MDSTPIIIAAVAEGLLWTIMALGIHISFRVLKRPGLTTEGSYFFGAAVCATLILININVDPF